MANRPALEQAVVNNVSLARTLIRKRYSLMADDELNEAIPAIRRELEAQAQTGKVMGLTIEQLAKLIFGEGQ